jgi:hypothetical protein
MEQVLRLYFSTFAVQKMVQTQQPIRAREKVIKGFKKSFGNFYFYFASKRSSLISVQFAHRLPMYLISAQRRLVFRLCVCRYFIVILSVVMLNVLYAVHRGAMIATYFCPVMSLHVVFKISSSHGATFYLISGVNQAMMTSEPN